MPDHPTHPDIDLLDGDFYAGDPFPLYAWMREHAPVYWDAKNELWAITRHADVQEVAKTPELFCNGQGMRPKVPSIPSMINMDGKLHKQRRGLVNRGFTPRRIAEQEGRVREVCRDLIARIAPRGECDFVMDFAAHVPMIMIGDMLGVAPEDRDMLLRWSDDLLRGTHASADPEAAMLAMNAFGEYAEYNERVVADRRANPGGDDLMSLLVDGVVDGERLDDEALLQESLLILIGGDETTRHVMTGGMYQLLRNPDQCAALRADPAKIPTAVEEMLRWVTPIQNMARTVTRETTYGGQTMREGQKLVLLYPSANRDERVFDAPEVFDTTRSPNEHLAFGGYGPHFCLGSALARLELRVFFEEVLPVLPDLELVDDTPPRLRSSDFVVGIEHMPVRFTPFIPRP